MARKLVLCLAASGVGFWHDGLGAWMSLQAMCADGSPSWATVIELHLLLLPATCLAMFVAALLCHRGAPFNMRDFGLMPGVIGALLNACCAYVLMMMTMSAGERIATLIDNSPQAAFYGGIAGTAVFGWAHSMFFSFPRRTRAGGQFEDSRWISGW